MLSNLPLELKIHFIGNLGVALQKSYTMGIYCHTKKREQCRVISEFDEILTLVVSLTTDGMQNKQKQG